MQPEHNSGLSFDHVPSAAELAQMYSQTEQDDPRSLFYKRVLVRPKVPVGWLALFVLMGVLAGGLAYMGVYALGENTLLAILACVTVLLLLGLVFAKRLLITAVRTYQALAPAKVRNRCRYEPSCSVYMIAAVEKYGFWRGFRKGMTRWRGCKPPNGGYDLP